MKSVIQACWIVTSAFGDLLVVILSIIKPVSGVVSLVKNFIMILNLLFKISDRPKFGLVPISATTSTGTEIPVPVSDIFRILVPAGNSVQNATENIYYKALFSFIALLSF